MMTIPMLNPTHKATYDITRRIGRRVLSCTLLFCSMALLFGVEISEINDFCENLGNSGEFSSQEFNRLFGEDNGLSESERLSAHTVLLQSYVTEYLPRGFNRNEQIENQLLAELPVHYLSQVLLRSAETRDFNPFISDVRQFLEAKTSSMTPEQRKRSKFALHIWDGTWSYHELEGEDDPRWRNIITNLEQAAQLYPLRDFSEILLEGYLTLREGRKYFETIAYGYFDAEDPGIRGYLSVLSAYFRIPWEREGPFKEIESVRQQVLNDAANEFPDIAMTTLPSVVIFDLAGQEVVLNERTIETMFHGRRTAIFLFYTECEFCRKEIHALNSLMKHVNPNNRIIAINTLYTWQDDIRLKVQEFARNHSMKYPVYIDHPHEPLSIKLGIHSVPTILLIDETGRIVSTIRFARDGHIKMKLEHYVIEFLRE